MINETVNATITNTNSTGWLSSYSSYAQHSTFDLFVVAFAIGVALIVIGTGLQLLKFGWDRQAVLDSAYIGLLSAACAALLWVAFVRLVL